MLFVKWTINNDDLHEEKKARNICQFILTNMHSHKFVCVQVHIHIHVVINFVHLLTYNTDDYSVEVCAYVFLES